MNRASLAACAVAGAVAGGCAGLVSADFHHEENTTTVTVVTAGYAAMDEVPVGGGELRLVAPVDIEIDTGEPTQAIAFPLRHTDVTVDVAGTVAVYTVEQTFDNPFDQPLEAAYVFPLGARAAVVGYQLRLGDRTVTGEIQTRAQARATYEQARAGGHTAALLEQEQPNVFSQHIANIPPRETVRVRLEYVETVAHADDADELVFPMVVGPRYLPAGYAGRHPVGSRREGAPARPDAVSIPYVEAEQVSGLVTFRARIDIGVPIAEVDSPTHTLQVGHEGATAVTVRLADGDSVPNRDLVVRYRSAGERTLVGLATHREGTGPGFFTLVIEPRQSYRTGDIVPRDVVLLIDASGSMDGEPLRQAQAVARAVIGTLDERDVFNVVRFSDDNDMLASAPLGADVAGRARGTAFVDGLSAGGGTEMGAGVLAALTAPDGGRLRTVYILSDGLVGNDDQIVEAARRMLKASRIFPVGIGAAPNRSLLDRLATVGRGSASYLAPGDDPAAVVAALLRRSAYPYLADVTIDWGGLAVADVTPAVLPDVPAGMPLAIAGRYLAPGHGLVEVRATSASGPVTVPLDVVFPEEADHPAVRYAWARQRVEELTSGPESDGAAVERAVTAIGLEQHMVTAYTSFVAVDCTRVVDGRGGVRVVEQPAAAPAGINLDMAVGPEATPALTPARHERSHGGGGGWGGGGGGDMDPLTLLLLALTVPATLSLRRAMR